jgi:hypothetical protein
MMIVIGILAVLFLLWVMLVGFGVAVGLFAILVVRPLTWMFHKLGVR